MFFKVEPHLSVLSKDAETTKVHFRISGKAQRSENASQPVRTQINIATALDRSGSMQGEPLRRAKEAEKFLVKNLTDKDTFALVVFDNESQVICPISQVSSKEKLYKLIDSINVGGCTNIGAGLLDCFQELSNVMVQERGSVNRILLLSDGQNNAGLSAKMIVERIEKEINQRGFTLSTFGLGNSYDRDLLTNLANVGKGSFYHIVNSDDIPKYYAEEFGDILDIALMRAKLMIRSSDGVSVQKIYGYEKENNCWQVGSFYTDETRDLLLEVEVSKGCTDPNVEVVLVAETPMGEIIEKMYSCQLRFGTEQESLDSKLLEVCKFADEVAQAFYTQEAYKKVESGDFNGAKAFYANFEPHNDWGLYHQSGIIDDSTYSVNDSLRSDLVSTFANDSWAMASSKGLGTMSGAAMAYTNTTLSGRSGKRKNRLVDVNVI